MTRSNCPNEWITLCKAGKSAKWIAEKFGVADWRVVRRALYGCGAYRLL